MTLPLTGAIKLSEVADEYQAPFKVPMSELVRGGEYVPDSGAGFPNEDVPETPPIALTDFYGGEDNPNPIQLETFFLSGAGEHVGLNADGNDEGLIVDAFDGSINNIPPDARFVIEAVFKMGPAFDTDGTDGVYTPKNGSYGQCVLTADLTFGLCTVNPNIASFGSVLANMYTSIRLRFYRSYDSAKRDQGPLRIAYGSGGGEYMDDPPEYGYLQVIPSSSSYISVRISRGGDIDFDSNTDLWTAPWNIEVYDNDFGSLWNTQLIDDRSAYRFAGGGYLTVLNNEAVRDGNLDATFDYIKAYAGGYVPPW